MLSVRSFIIKLRKKTIGISLDWKNISRLTLSPLYVIEVLKYVYIQYIIAGTTLML